MVASAKEHNHMHLEGQGRRRLASDQGYAMAALLVTLAIMSLMMTVAMPVWRHQAQREKEAELIFRAGQYVHAIELYKRKFANTYPPSVDVLIKSRFLRKKFTDPMTKDGEFRLISPQELAGTPTGIRNTGGGPQGSRQSGGFSSGSQQQGGGSSFGSQGGGSGSAGGAGSVDNRLGSGTALTGQGLGSASGTQPFSSPGGSLVSPGTDPASAFGSGSTSGPGGTINIGPIAAVVSKSTDQSIRIFKGRDHYNQWIVTIDDVMPRQLLRQQQPGQQPGQTPNNRPGQPSTGSPGSPSSSPTRSPSSSSPMPSRP
jgi:type II secretory pathway pseudopilin PulG